MKRNRLFIYLAKLGIVNSTNEDGNSDIQHIDDPENFAIDNELDFVPPLISGDDEAKAIYKSINHSTMEYLTKL